jgi:hypothetical protein
MPVTQGVYEWVCVLQEPSNSRLIQAEYSIFMFPQTPKTSFDSECSAWIRFHDLAHSWLSERGATSSIVEMSLCPSYQSIIGMGEVALRPIFTQLRSEGDDPDQWFWALRAITNANPVPEDEQGDFSKMARRWIEWGKRQGYVR